MDEEELVEDDRNSIVYDGTQIEELDHFDIGEEEDELGEIAANEVNVWEDVPSTSYGHVKTKVAGNRKRGRRPIGQIVHMTASRQQPARAARVKSFQHIVNYDDEDDEFEQDVQDGSKNEASRVFVKSVVPGMHFDWPVFVDSVVSNHNAVNIIASEACSIVSERICTSVPQEFTSTGTFVLQVDSMTQKEMLYDDGLGKWSVAQAKTMTYRINDNLQVQQAAHNHNLKIVCEQFVHPGTDQRGDYIKRVYTGYNRSGALLPYCVISYEWIGEPHPVAVEFDHDGNLDNMGEKDAETFGDLPVFGRFPVDYDLACQLLLSFEKVERWGKRVPMNVRECIAFVVDPEECGGERALFADGNHWNRPSGANRFFRLLHDEDNELRVQRSSNDNFDVQVTCRRYDGIDGSVSSSLVKKVYVARISLPRAPHCDQLPNLHLALVSYAWKPQHVLPVLRTSNFVLPAPVKEAKIAEEAARADLFVMRRSDLDKFEKKYQTHSFVSQREENIDIMKTAIKEKKENNRRRLDRLVERTQRMLAQYDKQTETDANARTAIEQAMQIGKLLRSAT